MRITNKDITLKCLGSIKYLQEVIKSLEETHALAHKIVGYSGEVDHGDVREIIIRHEVDEWRRLCMFGLTLTPAEQDDIKALAHERFIANASVGHWLSPDGLDPGSILTKSEEEFRAMAREAFAPRGDSTEAQL